MDSNEMRDYIMEFSLDSCKLGNQGYTRVLLQLFGFAGHGKSSLINSFKYIIDNKPWFNYTEATDSHGAGTLKRTPYQLTSTITMVDNRGCRTLKKDEEIEICTQLGNCLPLGEPVEWNKAFDTALKILLESDREDRSADFIVPLFVYSADASMSDDDFKNIKGLLKNAKKITGLFPTVVVTHDHSKHILVVKENFRQMEVENLFSLENYTAEDHVKTRGKHETLVRCLYEIIKDVKFRMGLPRDAFTEKAERKRILITLMHNTEAEKEALKFENAALEKEKQHREQLEEEQRKTKEKEEQYKYALRRAEEAEKKNNNTCALQ